MDSREFRQMVTSVEFKKRDVQKLLSFSKFSFVGIMLDRIESINFANVQFLQCEGSESEFIACHFHRNLWDDCEFNSCSFTNSSFFLSRILATDFIECIFCSASLIGIYAKEVDLTGSDLSKADFEEAHLVNVDFTDCNLRETSMKNAHLEGAIFTGADLAGTDFSGAKLANITWGNSNYREAKGLTKLKIW